MAPKMFLTVGFFGLWLRLVVAGVAEYDLPADSALQNTMMTDHNTVRSTSVPPPDTLQTVSWDSQLAGTAAPLTASHTSSCQPALNHDSPGARLPNGYSGNVGQNLALKGYSVSQGSAFDVGSKQGEAWSSAIAGWEAEKADWTYGVGPNAQNDVVGHYTQVVWDISTKVGCHMAACKNTQDSSWDKYYYYTACNYHEGGNFPRNSDGSTHIGTGTPQQYYGWPYQGTVQTTTAASSGGGGTTTDGGGDSGDSGDSGSPPSDNTSPIATSFFM